MKNSTFFAIGLCVVNVGLYASENQIEGQPGAMAPGGLAISSSAAQPSCAAASSSSALVVMRYYEKGTQTDISANDDEQVRARLHVLLNDTDAMIVRVVEKKLSQLKEQAESGSIQHAVAISLFNKLVMAGSRREVYVTSHTDGAIPLLNVGFLDKYQDNSCELKENVYTAMRNRKR